MLFNSFDFLFVFLPLCLLAYFGLNRLGKCLAAKCVLVVFSLYFYAFFNLSYLPIILTSIVVNYMVGYMLDRLRGNRGRKAALCVGVLFNVLLLGYFKYYDFFVENLNALFSSNFALRHILLPLGISFFTFQQLAFCADSYKRTVMFPNFIDYCNFVTFFPQLIAGPIVLPQEMLSQFSDPKNMRVRYRNLFDGLFIFSMGLAKKVVIADSIAVFANAGFETSQTHFTMAEAWLVSLSYTMQLYFDFSGYCDMAIGLGRMFNINLPVNFDKPYIAQNFQEFWKRWHITLNRFLTQCVYIPLGGSRKGSFRTYVNILIVFLVSGLWHGAGWTFVLWGFFHGCGVVVCRLWRNLRLPLPRIPSILLTFFFVNILWVLFRADSVGRAWTVISCMFNNTDIVLTQTYRSHLPSIFPNTFNFILFVVASLMAFIGPTAYDLMNRWVVGRTLWAKSACAVALLVVGILLLNRVNTFLYFNF